MDRKIGSYAVFAWYAIWVTSLGLTGELKSLPAFLFTPCFRGSPNGPSRLESLLRCTPQCMQAKVLVKALDVLNGS